MIAWAWLIGAILVEVVATLSLKAGVEGRKIWYLPVAVGYILAFVFLSFALSAGMALGVAYGIWAAVGVALTAIASRIFFKEPFTWIMALGIILIMGGVLLIETGGAH